MNRVIVISGATSGLGLELAKHFSSQNTVYIISKSNVDSVCKSINCKGYEIDITKPNLVEETIAKIYEIEGHIDVLINNAGVWIQGELDTNSYEQIQNTFNVNTLGTIYLSKAVIPFYKKSNSGVIINIISQAGLYAKDERSIYHASKWAITGFTKCLAIELSKYNVKVSGIYPGLLNTKLFETAGYNRDLSNSLDVLNIVKGVEYVINAPKDLLVTELGLRHINNI